jgi:hypothetical protein
MAPRALSSILTIETFVQFCPPLVQRQASLQRRYIDKLDGDLFGENDWKNGRFEAR